MGTEGGGGGEEEKRKPIFRDIRRYYCDYCGICRSKKSLITAHVLANHKEQIKEKEVEGCEEEILGKDKNTCDECGASFRKLAYLKQHMRCHSLERPFACPADDCHLSYRRKDHLTRHLLQHQGKLFSCPVQNCNSRFSYQANMKRHVKEFHDEEDPVSCDGNGQKQHVCQEVGCGKVFKFASKLRKHEESHVKLDSIEAVCCEPGCMKVFSNGECLKAHFQSCHQYIDCEGCGSKQLKKNIKRHMQIHEDAGVSERIKCSYNGCQYTFATKSNLNQHVKAVHLELRPFACRIGDCGKKFPYRHVRDNHERTGSHIYVQGDFEESDGQFQSRPRGGRKRKLPTVEMLQRKRIIPPGLTDSALDQPSDYVAWLLSSTEPEEHHQ